MNTATLGYLTTCAVLSLVVIDIRPASAAILEWSLTFTNSQGIDVGNGGFSYNPDQVVVVRSPGIYSAAYVADKDAPLRSDFVLPPSFPGLFQVTTYPNPLVSFVANLPNRNWSFADIPGGLAWWNLTPAGTFGSFVCSRNSCAVSNQLFAGSPSGMFPGQFVMNGGTAQADGSYSGSFISVAISSAAPVSGTWTAQAVPEPTTILGALVCGMGYWATKVRRSR